MQLKDTCRHQNKCSSVLGRFRPVSVVPAGPSLLPEERPRPVPAGTIVQHQCRFCPYSTWQKFRLAVHERVHTGERPHRCHVCSRAFVQSAHLVGHMRSHTGERPFRCHVCNRGFALNSDRVRHMRSHTGERPYSCPHCPAVFAQCSSVKVHMRRYHDLHSGARRHRASPDDSSSGMP
ncbi:zinc finger protein 677-like isoform X2 [Dermacentor silvarum]|uniref:zinc finger protein 677-like isoform X2 n=1 Tax=Dermacentor silvarum TaxID=543639 RepID=UPI0021019B60|nr:zinc finger protein 677-like isoform X2 [Dermacentor silvarum]